MDSEWRGGDERNKDFLSLQRLNTLYSNPLHSLCLHAHRTLSVPNARCASVRNTVVSKDEHTEQIRSYIKQQNAHDPHKQHIIQLTSPHLVQVILTRVYLDNRSHTHTSHFSHLRKARRLS